MTVAASIAIGALGGAIYCVVQIVRRGVVGRAESSRGQVSPTLRVGAHLLADAIIAAAVIGPLSGLLGFRLGATDSIYIAVAAAPIIAAAILARLLSRRRRTGVELAATPEDSGPSLHIGRAGVLAVLVGGIFAEELVFRGFVRALIPQSPTVFITVSTAIFALTRLLPGTAVTESEMTPLKTRLRSLASALLLGPALGLLYALSGSLFAAMVIRLLVETAGRFVVIRESETAKDDLPTLRQTVFLSIAALVTIPLTGWWYLFR